MTAEIPKTLTAMARRVLRTVPALLVLVAGCTAIRPADTKPSPSAPLSEFSHELLGRVQQDFVDGEGRVDYIGLAADPDDLERYYALVARYSPDSHPELFPNADSRLAYWINAYNTAVLKTVLKYYPITSVGDVRPLFFLPDNSSFFYLQRPIFGGESTSLYDLEHDVVRKRFAEPRIHFALNCASRGCPRLPTTAFTAANLDTELDRETRRFLAEDRNFRIDDEAAVVYLSSLFSWYEEDFLTWIKGRVRGEAGLLDYVRHYVPQTAELDRAADYEIRFTPYDWRLNDAASV